MDWFETWALTLGVFIPALGAVVVMLLPRGSDRLVRAMGIVFSGLALLVGIAILFGYDFGAPGAFGTAAGS